MRLKSVVTAFCFVIFTAFLLSSVGITAGIATANASPSTKPAFGISENELLVTGLKHHISLSQAVCIVSVMMKNGDRQAEKAHRELSQKLEIQGINLANAILSNPEGLGILREFAEGLVEEKRGFLMPLVESIEEAAVAQASGGKAGTSAGMKGSITSALGRIRELIEEAPGVDAQYSSMQSAQLLDILRTETPDSFAFYTNAGNSGTSSQAQLSSDNTLTVKSGEYKALESKVVVYGVTFTGRLSSSKATDYSGELNWSWTWDPSTTQDLDGDGRVTFRDANITIGNNGGIYPIWMGVTVKGPDGTVSKTGIRMFYPADEPAVSVPKWAWWIPYDYPGLYEGSLCVDNENNVVATGNIMYLPAEDIPEDTSNSKGIPDIRTPDIPPNVRQEDRCNPNNPSVTSINVTSGEGIISGNGYSESYPVVSAQPSSGRRPDGLPAGNAPLDGDQNVRVSKTAAGAKMYIYTDLTGAIHLFDSRFNPLGATAATRRTLTAVEGGGYKAGFPDGSGQIFDADGFVTKSVERHGQTTTYTRDGQGRVIRITDPFGRNTLYRYAGAKVSEIEKPDGTVLKYLWNSDGTIAAFTDAGGGVCTWEYTAGRVSTYTDSAGNKTKFEYHFHGAVKRITKPDGGIWCFDLYASRRGSIVTDPQGAKTFYEFDKSGRITKVTDPSGRVTALSGFSAGGPQEVRASDGSVTRYSWDSTARLVSKTDELGAVTTYRYLGNTHFITEINEPEDRKTLISYNSTSDPVEITRPDGTKLQLDYDNTGFMTSFTDAMANRTTFTKDAYGGISGITDATGRTFTFGRDIMGRPLELADPAGNRRKWAWDAQGRITETTDALGSRKTFRYDNGGRLVSVTDRTGAETDFAWDRSGNLASAKNPDGGETSYTYDRLSHLLKSIDPEGAEQFMTWDETGRPKTITDPLGAITSLAYDMRGQLVRISDPRGGHTRFTWDAAGRLSILDDAARNRWEMKYNANGELVETKDLDGRITKIQRDKMGRPVRITDPSGGNILYAYDANGNLTEIKDQLGRKYTRKYDALNRPVSATDPLGNTQTIAYDISGNIQTVTDALGNTTRYSYDPEGRITEITAPQNAVTRITRDPEGRVVSMTDPEGIHTQLARDIMGRITSVIKPLGITETFSYDKTGRMLSATDPNGNRTEYTWGGAGCSPSGCGPTNRLVQVKDALGGLTKYAWDATGNLTGITDGNGNTRNFAWDLVNRLVSETDPLGNTTKYAYGRNGLLSRKTTAEGQTTAYEYNPLGNLTKILYSTGRVASMDYDATGNMTRLKEGTAGASTLDVLFRYDELDRLSEQNALSLGKIIKYEYDGNGNRKTMTDPRSGKTQYTYNTLNLPEQVADPYGAKTGYVYDRSGRRKSAGQKNYSYDSAGRLSGLRYGPPQQPDYPGSYRFDYTLDKSGNILTKNVTNQGQTRYQYDSLNRLIKAEYHDGEWEAFEYDKAGNRTRRTAKTLGSGEETYKYNTANQLLEKQARIVADDGNTVLEKTTYLYNRNGQLISETVETVAANSIIPGGRKTETWLYGYDEEGRLVKITFPDGKTNEHKFCALGKRIYSKWADGQEEYRLYDGQDILATYDGNQNETARYVYGPEMDEPIRRYAMGGVESYMTDHLGSIIRMNSGRGPVRKFDYRAFGEKLTLYEAPGTGEGSGYPENPFGFTGREFEYGTDLLYYRARSYDPMVGRFMSADPYTSMVMMGQGLNNASTGGFNPLMMGMGSCGAGCGTSSMSSASGTGSITPELASLLMGGQEWNGFAYVGNNPINFTDPYGLYGEEVLEAIAGRLPKIPSFIVNFTSGFGDSLSFGFSGYIRSAKGTKQEVCEQSKTYQSGELTSFFVGSGRTLYAGSAKILKYSYQSIKGFNRARKIASARNKLKTIFRFGLFKEYRKYTFDYLVDRYKTPDEIIKAATRTNDKLNALGFDAMFGSIVNHFWFTGDHTDD